MIATTLRSYLAQCFDLACVFEKKGDILKEEREKVRPIELNLSLSFEEDVEKS